MLDGKDFDIADVDSVCHYVGRSEDDQFARTSYTSWTSEAWFTAKPLNASRDGAYHACRGSGIVCLDIACRFRQVGCSARLVQRTFRFTGVASAFVYLAIVAATSASLANSPRSASRKPASISASCHASRVT